MERHTPITGEDVAKMVGCWDLYMASQQKDILNELTPETIAHGEFPVRALLYNSVYYPASAFDGGVIRDCNVNRKDWNALSFVYVDYKETPRSLDSICRICGARAKATATSISDSLAMKFDVTDGCDFAKAILNVIKRSLNGCGLPFTATRRNILKKSSWLIRKRCSTG